MSISTDKINIGLVYFALIIGILLISDSYYAPLIGKWEQLEDKSYYSQSYRRSRNHTYVFKVANKEFDVPKYVYGAFSVNDSIYVQKSKFSGVILRVGYCSEGDLYYYKIGIINSGIGWFLTPVLMIFSILLRIFYYKIKTMSIRNKLSGLAWVWALATLFMYLFFS